MAKAIYINLLEQDKITKEDQVFESIFSDPFHCPSPIKYQVQEAFILYKKIKDDSWKVEIVHNTYLMHTNIINLRKYSFIYHYWHIRARLPKNEN